VPFTDPIAEGPIIQKAHDRALQKNVSLSLIFNMIKDFRIEDNKTPIVLMGYLNTFISHKDLIKNNEENAIDSILVVDIPGEVNLADYGLESSNVNTISLISPTTKENRIKSIAQNSSGFVYYVTLRGVTGSSNLNIDEISKNIEEIKKYASVPTLAGFGIKSTDDAKLLAKCSDGVIIGSSIVKMIEESSNSREFDRIGQYITEIKQAIS
jgi:tryptophan synthase alpha chain